MAALELLEERPHRVQRLRSNARALRRGLAAEGFPVSDCEMHIVPLVVGDERAAMSLCQAGIEQGVFAQAIRPPTVPAGTSRLRITAMASHTATELRMAAEIFGAAARRLGLDPAAMSSPSSTPEPEIDEIETALARAERLASRPSFDRDRADSPFDLARDDASALFDLDHDPARAGQPTEAWLESSLDEPTRETAGTGAGPFDFERETSSARAA
jgi:hypothetical protein